VIDGKMTREEFLMAAKPSPDHRDSPPVTILDARIAILAAAARRRADVAAARASKIAHFRNERVWSLAGFWMEDSTPELYSLSNLERWADWAGYPLRGSRATVSAVLMVEGETGEIIVDLSGHFYDSDNPGRLFNFDKCKASLRKFVASELATASK
jgi:hypothetical protein